MAGLQPLGDMILVQSVVPEEAKKGGIIIPDIAQEKPLQAKVVKVGLGVLPDGTSVSYGVVEGDVVLIGKYSGTEVEFDGEKYILLSINDVLAKVP